MNWEYNLYFATLLFAVMFLSSCSTVDNIFAEEETRLEGERISALKLQKELEPDNTILTAQGLVTPEPWRNEFWPQAGGYPNHAMQNLTLSTEKLQQLWSTKIGQGSTRALPLTAQPVVIDDTIFTLDTKSTLAAFSAKEGKKLWAVHVGNEDEKDPVISGGLGYSHGTLYVTNGYNTLLAVNPANGEITWRAKLPSAARAAPTIMDGRVFVTTLDNRLICLNAEDGQIQWEFSGISESTALIGAASPAASREIVVPAFSSGELFALRVKNGSVSWAENLAPLRQFPGLSALSDIRGLPVIDKGIVIAVSFGGSIVAIDAQTGQRIWQRDIGGSETPWVAGNHLFMLTSENELVALGRDDGTIRWVIKLQKYKNPGKRKNPIVWTGPVFAGGRLIVAGTDGRVIEVSPEDGQIIREWSTGRTVSISPVIAAGTLYLLADDGTLMAYQ